MDILSQVAVHYYDKLVGPLASLSIVGEKELLQIQHKFISTEQEQTEYMKMRRSIEKIMYRSFIRKGGSPKQTFAYYFTIGPKDILANYYQHPASLSIPINYFDPAVVSFTYCDSFLTYSRTDNHPTRRKLYMVSEIGKIIDEYGMEFDDDDYMALIEMQLWDVSPLLQYCREHKLIRT